MGLSFTGKKRIRKNFGRIPEAVEMPNLIEVQKHSYEQFLMKDTAIADRPDEGLQAVFKSVFPVKDFSERSVLEFVSYEFEPPKFDVEECVQRDMTYAAPLKVKMRLIVFDVDEETGARSVKDIKEQDVYMGDIPLMTDKGTFIINGTERVIVSQMHRSPGVFFDHDKGKTHASGKYLFAARIIPYRGSWLDLEFDAKDILHVRIDRRRKLPATTLLYALGLDKEEILSTFYDKIVFEKAKDGWTMPYLKERWRGVKPQRDLVDARSGDVVAPAGKKLSARAANKLADDGLEKLLISAEDLYGRFAAEDLVNLETGEAAGGHAEGDTLTGVENLTGSDHNDALTGDAGANTLQGGSGNDALEGGAGDALHLVQDLPRPRPLARGRADGSEDRTGFVVEDVEAIDPLKRRGVALAAGGADPGELFLQLVGEPADEPATKAELRLTLRAVDVGELRTQEGGQGAVHPTADAAGSGQRLASGPQCRASAAYRPRLKNW